MRGCMVLSLCYLRESEQRRQDPRNYKEVQLSVGEEGGGGVEEWSEKPNKCLNKICSKSLRS